MPIIIEESDSLVTDIQVNLGIFDQLQEGILLANGEKEITFINSYALQMSGYNEEEVLGQIINDSLFQFYKSNDQRLNSSQCPVTAAIYNRTAFNEPVYFISGNDQQVFINLKIIPIEDSYNNIIGTFISMMEIKDTQEIEEAYLQLKTKLEESRIIMKKLLEANELLNNELQR